jgi:hypothetical protein
MGRAGVSISADWDGGGNTERLRPASPRIAAEERTLMNVRDGPGTNIDPNGIIYDL